MTSFRGADLQTLALAYATVARETKLLEPSATLPFEMVALETGASASTTGSHSPSSKWLCCVKTIKWQAQFANKWGEVGNYMQYICFNMAINCDTSTQIQICSLQYTQKVTLKTNSVNYIQIESQLHN